MFDPDKLRQIRISQGYEQAEIAKRAGMSPQAWHRLEAGDRPDPRISTVQLVAKVLGVNIADLLNDEKPGRNKVSHK